MAPFPARVHVLLASSAPVGVVIRRGPAKCVATMLWDRRRDRFELGQWLKGRIYERRCDLSPDGKYLIYFAMNGKWNSPSQGAWTAVSRAPYLKALSMFPKGDCWNGGGLWTNKRTYWLNDGVGHTVLHDTNEVRRDRRYQPAEYFGGECPGVYYLRLRRDGWQPLGPTNATVFEKSVGHGWRLRRIAHAEMGAAAGKGCYWDEHQLWHAETDRETAYPDWEWADIDGERLVWVEQGKLFCGQVQSAGLSAATQLFDFNPMEFEAIEAPY